MMGTKKAAARRARGPARPSAATGDNGFEYRPLTWEEAEALVDDLLDGKDDEGAWQLIRLMHGLINASFRSSLDCEGLANAAARRAYGKTIHYEDALERFAMLNPADRAGMYPGVANVAS